MSNGNATASFECFFHGWLQRQQTLLDEMIAVQEPGENPPPSTEELDYLGTRILAHYQDYYEEKSRQIHENVFELFAPPWFSAFEHTFFWIAGFKPSITFRLVRNSVNDMTEDQNQRIERLKTEIRMEEKTLSDELAKIQESVAAPPIMELARRQARRRNGDMLAEDEQAIDGLRTVTKTLVTNADLLRTSTATKVSEILTPIQNVRFWAAVARFQLKVRKIGMEREEENNE